MLSYIFTVIPNLIDIAEQSVKVNVTWFVWCPAGYPLSVQTSCLSLSRPHLAPGSCGQTAVS